MRAIPSRIESVAFASATPNDDVLRPFGSSTQAWEIPSGAIERRAFEVSTSCVKMKDGTSATAAEYAARPIVEFYVGPSVAAVFSSGTCVGRFPVGVRVPVSFSLEPGLFLGARIVGKPVFPAQGAYLVGAVLTYERQA